MSSFIKTGVIVTIILALTTAYQVPLLRSTNDNHFEYLLDILYNKQPFKVKLQLGTGPSWIKSASCSICVKNNCSKKCGKLVGPANKGITCEANCSNSTQKFKDNTIEGQYAEIQYNLRDINKKQIQKKSQLVIAQKVLFQVNNQTKSFDGILDLLNSQNSQYPFNQFVLMHDKTPLLVFDEEITARVLQDKNANLSLKNDQIDTKIESIVFNNQEINGHNSSFFIGLNISGIRLPELVYQMFQQKLLNAAGNNCTFVNSTLKCLKNVNTSKLQNIILAINLADKQNISLPLEAFMKNCKAKVCQIWINKNDYPGIIVGEIFLMMYAARFDLLSTELNLFRLKNVWSTKLEKLESVLPQQKSTQNKRKPIIAKNNTVKNTTVKNTSNTTAPANHQYFGYLLTFIKWWVYLVILFACLTLMINVCYNRERLIRYFQNFMQKRNKKQEYQQAYTEEIDYTSTVVQGYDVKVVAKQFWEENSVEGI